MDASFRAVPPTPFMRILCLILLGTVLLGGMCVAGLNWCLRKADAAERFTW